MIIILKKKNLECSPLNVPRVILGYCGPMAAFLVYQQTCLRSRPWGIRSETQPDMGAFSNKDNAPPLSVN